MDKRDIYEHLAKIYLDASSKKKGPPKTHPKILKAVFSVTVLIVIGFGFILFFKPKTGPTFSSETRLVLLHETAKLNFQFDPAKKEIYALDLKNLNLSQYKQLGFAVKKSGYQDVISLRVEFSNIYKEVSEVYLKDIAYRWQDYKIDLANFKNISDWSEMSSLSFTVEEWNVRSKKGIVYIDNVRLLN